MFFGEEMLMKHKMSSRMEGSLLPNQKQSALNTSQSGDKFVVSQLCSWREFCQEGLTAFKLHRAFFACF